MEQAGGWGRGEVGEGSPAGVQTGKAEPGSGQEGHVNVNSVAWS